MNEDTANGGISVGDHFVAMLETTGYDVTFRGTYVGGGTLKQVWEREGTQDLVASGDYDLMILQGRNGIGGQATEAFRAEFEDYANRFVDLADANGTETTLFGLWANDFQIAVDKGDTFGPEFDELYSQTAQELGVGYSPSGLAYARAHSELTALYGNGDNGQTAEDLLTYDTIHPSQLGAYLAANVLYYTTVGTPPPDQDAYLPQGISRSDAELMQQIAAETAELFGINPDADWLV